jgi:hypothetical protein
VAAFTSDSLSLQPHLFPGVSCLHQSHHAHEILPVVCCQLHLQKTCLQEMHLINVKQFEHGTTCVATLARRLALTNGSSKVIIAIHTTHRCCNLDNCALQWVRKCHAWVAFAQICRSRNSCIAQPYAANDHFIFRNLVRVGPFANFR